MLASHYAPGASVRLNVARVASGEALLAFGRHRAEGWRDAVAMRNLSETGDLREAAATLTNRGNFQGALELLAYEQDLEPKLPVTFFARLGDVYEKRGQQLERIAKSRPTPRRRPAERPSRPRPIE